MKLPQSSRCRRLPLACCLTLALLLCAGVTIHAQQSGPQYADYNAPRPRASMFSPKVHSRPIPRARPRRSVTRTTGRSRSSNAPKYAAAGWSYVNYHRDDPKRLEKAWGYFHRAIICDDEYIDAYYGRGLTLMSLNRFSRALDDFNLVLSKEPDRQAAYPMRLRPRGNRWIRRRRYTEGRRAGPGTRRSDQTQQPVLPRAQGIIAEKRRDYPAAVAHLSWAIEHGFDAWTCRGYRAVAYEQLQDYPAPSLTSSTREGESVVARAVRNTGKLPPRIGQAWSWRLWTMRIGSRPIPRTLT